jgi:thiamine biosynthesis lipoprotein
MATHFELRIAGPDPAYAAQAGQAAFDLLDSLEARLSRFRPTSDIARLAYLAPGEAMRVADPVFACLQLAQHMEQATHGAISSTPSALQRQPAPPQWTLLPSESAIRCVHGRLEFDLGAIGKGFALDRMGQLLRDWDCTAFLLIAGGSSILAGDPPAKAEAWSCGLGDDDATERLALTNASLSGSGLAVKGEHIFDPRTGLPAARQGRAWALTDTAAESDALSTAAMVLTEPELQTILLENPSWLIFLDTEVVPKAIGRRPKPRFAAL